jgi:nicotinamidase-related amidase
MQRLDPSRCSIAVIDVQERLAAAMPSEDLTLVERAIRLLVAASKEFRIPVAVTEQYPKGLGRTLPGIEEALAGAQVRRFEKVAFSACDAEGFSDALDPRRPTVVLVGMEAHVCVFQTARDLVERGFQVRVPLDGVCSRRRDHRDVGLELCREAGAKVTTAESTVFDWLGQAGTESFRTLAGLVR